MKVLIFYRKGRKTVYPEVYMDIGNKCNGMCKYCLTGSLNRMGKTKDIPPYFMDEKEFERMATHMRDCGMITPDCMFRIYNWYEPMLNPHLPEIINYLNKTNFKLDMSTNASVLPDFNRIESCSCMCGLLFSMPGFSQKSYDRMHGFDFEKVKSNIRTIMKEFRAKGFKGDAYINFHLYQFNFHEAREAKAFADELGIRLHTIFAYFNGAVAEDGSSEWDNYLKNRMSMDRVKEINQELFFHFVQELLDNSEYYIEKFKEPPSITLSERCNVIPGRGSNDDSRIVSIYDLHSYEEVKAVYDKLAAERPDDPDNLKVMLWAHQYKISRNYLFGF